MIDGTMAGVASVLVIWLEARSLLPPAPDTGYLRYSSVAGNPARKAKDRSNPNSLTGTLDSPRLKGAAENFESGSTLDLRQKFIFYKNFNFG